MLNKKYKQFFQAPNKLSNKKKRPINKTKQKISKKKLFKKSYY